MKKLNLREYKPLTKINTATTNQHAINFKNQKTVICFRITSLANHQSKIANQLNISKKSILIFKNFKLSRIKFLMIWLHQRAWLCLTIRKRIKTPIIKLAGTLISLACIMKMKTLNSIKLKIWRKQNESKKK